MLKWSSGTNSSSEMRIVPATGRGHAHGVPVLAQHVGRLGDQAHADLGVVRLVVEHRQVGVRSVDAPRSEGPGALDHPAAVDAPGAPGHAPRAAAHRASPVADPGRVVDRPHHLVGEGRAPHVAAGRGPERPSRRPAAPTERLVDAKQVPGREVRPAEAWRHGEGIGASLIKPLNGLLGHASLALRFGLHAPEPRTRFDDPLDHLVGVEVRRGELFLGRLTRQRRAIVGWSSRTLSHNRLRSASKAPTRRPLGRVAAQHLTPAHYMKAARCEAFSRDQVNFVDWQRTEDGSGSLRPRPPPGPENRDWRGL